MLIHNATILTMNDRWEIQENSAIYVEGDLIREMGQSGELLQKYKEPAALDARGRVVMPGFINAHMHLYSTFARGITLKDTPPVTFNEILERLWWRLDKALDNDAVRMSAYIPLIQAIRCGTTTLIDHHASPHAITGSLDIIAELFESIGLRGALCYEVSDRDGAKAATAGIAENVRFLERCTRERPSLLSGMFGLHASFTLSDGTLAQCLEAAAPYGAGFHVHCAEAISDVEHANAHFGKGVVERFATAGILGRNTIAAHCVHVTEKEIGILGETKTNVVHNPRSNMNNAVGCAPALKMMRAGVRVGLGTDGMSACMTDELKTALLLHKHESRDPRTGWTECPEMLFRANPRIASEIFGANIGVIEAGAKADLIILDYFPPTPMTPQNLAGHILFGLADAPVVTTIVGGKILMKDCILTEIDEEEVSRRAREVAKEVWKRF
jgi:putative selenium metabolism protein SsnA